MKKLLVVSVALLLLGAISSVTLAHSVTYMVLQGTARPLQIEEPNDPLKGGLITEVIVEMFKDAPYKLEILHAPWNRLDRELQAGLSNWIVYGSHVYEDGKRLEAGSLPKSKTLEEAITSIRSTLVSPKSSGFVFNELEDLFGKPLILIFTFDYPGLDEYLQSKVGGPILDQRAQNPEQALQMLVRGRGVGFVEEEIRVRYNMKDFGYDAEDFNFYDFSSVWGSFDLTFQFDENMPEEVVDFMNQRLREMKESGVLDAIVNQYL